MIINFIGLFNAPGYVGEISDETHLARELEELGHTVNRIQRDEWKAFIDGEDNPNWKLPTQADINLIAKWHHFNDGKYIIDLKWKSQAPVFYWVWDFMPNPDFPDWHLEMARAADLYLSGELGIFHLYKERGVKPYYFQMDVCDGEIPIFDSNPESKIHNVVFTGSCIDQGHRKEWLQIINKQIPIRIYGWGYEEWEALGLDAFPPVYGEEYNRLIAQSKVVLGLSVEPNCFGYWSNRVGKVLKAGGLLLQEYAPGMEQLLPANVEYFSSPEEAIEKLRMLLGEKWGPELSYDFTSKNKAKQLAVLMERYLKSDNGKDWLL